MLKRVWHDVGSSGFTLLEMVVTLTILGFILLIIFGAFRLGISAWEKGESSREEYQKVRAVSQLVSRQLKSMVPYKIKTEKAEGDYLAFEGSARSLKFVSALSMKAKQPEGFVYAIYEFKDGGNEGGRLVVYEQRVLIRKNFFEERPNEESGVPLIEGISDIRFEYYQEEDSLKNREEGWVEEWDAKEEKDLPRAIRMTVTYKSGQSEKEETPMTLLASVSANRFEDVKPPSSVGFVRRSTPQRPQGGN
ncbi:MAG: type II secretion system protein GspJ [Thermodesulfobacteriota bacterium]